MNDSLGNVKQSRNHFLITESKRDNDFFDNISTSEITTEACQMVYCLLCMKVFAQKQV